MIRMTREQASLFGFSTDPRPKKAVNSKAKNAAPRQKKKKEDLPENIIEGQISDFLRSRGWLLKRNNVGSFIPTGVIMRLVESGQVLDKSSLFRGILRIGEKGMPDWTAERLTGTRGIVQQFFWEAKGPKQRPSAEQKQYMATMRALGHEVDWYDDFDDVGGPHSFLDWYRKRYPKEF